MISYLSGKTILKEDKFIVVDVNGVGYKIFLSLEKIIKVKKGEKISVFCCLRTKNDAWDLYGFLTKDELEFFEFLMCVPGIGPKAALEISAMGSLGEFKKAIENEDEEVLNKLFLSGKKKAQAIIFEISRKIKTEEKKHGKEDSDVIHALVKLGFSRKEVKEELKKIDSKISKTEDKIKEVLKNLGNDKCS